MGRVFLTPSLLQLNSEVRCLLFIGGVRDTSEDDKDCCGNRINVTIPQNSAANEHEETALQTYLSSTCLLKEVKGSFTLYDPCNGNTGLSRLSCAKFETNGTWDHNDENQFP